MRGFTLICNECGREVHLMELNREENIDGLRVFSPITDNINEERVSLVCQCTNDTDIAF